ncbi:MAG TPA: hypothetical protein VNE63_24300 [Candidatus Acidoferrales bacterium]|nr:hypothetical protein [Candidatus Acidoferrales bacterium]
MRYEKPEITVVASASIVIQAGSKGANHISDMSFHPTVGAYEADE